MLVNNKLKKKMFQDLQSIITHYNIIDDMIQVKIRLQKILFVFFSLQCKIVVQFKYIGMHVKAIKMLIVTS